MIRIFFFGLAILLSNINNAQLLKVSPGSDVTILNGTVFKIENLILTPSSDFTLSDNTLNKSTTVIHPTANPYINRVYQFTNNTNPFSGSVQINYTDGAELNGIAEPNLTLNINNGTSWDAYSATTRDATNNFVLTNNLIAISLNELTLASLLAPLPLTWLSFTATAQNNSQSLLQWATAIEQNTQSFYIQHSTDGINWVTIGILSAAGNSNTTSNYSYVHTNPVMGIHYYRIKQTDTDYRYSYSPVRTVLFTTAIKPFIIMGNPVTNDILLVRMYSTSPLMLYTSDGILLWQETVNVGITSIDVSRYAKGTYLLKTNNTTQKVVIQ